MLTKGRFINVIIDSSGSAYLCLVVVVAVVLGIVIITAVKYSRCLSHDLIDQATKSC